MFPVRVRGATVPDKLFGVQFNLTRLAQIGGRAKHELREVH